MMRWLLWRELTVMTRTRAVWAAMCLQLLVLAAFLLVWGDGAPTMRGNLADQFSTLHAALLLIVLPWVAARVVGDGGTVARVAMLGAGAPRHVVASKYVALLLVLLALVASAVPFTILALRISGVELWRGLLDLPSSVALCMLAAAIVTTSVVAGLSRLAAWVAGTVAMCLVGAVLSPAPAPVLMLGALIVIGFAALRADQWHGALPIEGAR